MSSPPNMGNPVNASKFNAGKLVPPAPPKLQFMDMPKLNFVDSEKLPPIPGAVPSEGLAASATGAASASAAKPVPVPQLGGRKSRKSAKKSTASKSTKGKSSKKASGGALIDDVKNLAVPFAILLAKQGLQTMFDKKKSAPQAQSQLTARAASQPSSSRRRSTAVGGSCGSACAAAVRPAAGGKSKKSCGGAGAAVVTKLPGSGAVRGGTTAKLPVSGAAARGGALPKPPKSLTGGSRSQQVKSRFEKLSREIDAFLQKY